MLHIFLNYHHYKYNFEVSKYGRDNEVNEEQELNIETKVLTLFVLKLEIFR